LGGRWWGKGRTDRKKKKKTRGREGGRGKVFGGQGEGAGAEVESGSTGCEDVQTDWSQGRGYGPTGWEIIKGSFLSGGRKLESVGGDVFRNWQGGAEKLRE